MHILSFSQKNSTLRTICCFYHSLLSSFAKVLRCIRVAAIDRDRISCIASGITIVPRTRSRVGCLEERFTIGRAIFYFVSKKEESRKRQLLALAAVKWPVGEGLKRRVTRAIKVAQSVIEVW